MAGTGGGSAATSSCQALYAIWRVGYGLDVHGYAVPEQALAAIQSGIAHHLHHRSGGGSALLSALHVLWMAHRHGFREQVQDRAGNELQTLLMRRCVVSVMIPRKVEGLLCFGLRTAAGTQGAHVASTGSERMLPPQQQELQEQLLQGQQSSARSLQTIRHHVRLQGQGMLHGHATYQGILVEAIRLTDMKQIHKAVRQTDKSR